MKREGYWENGMTRPGGALNQLFPLPADVLDGRQKDGFTYPVAIYDHHEGQAVSGGFAYYGRIASLRGKFVFGDIQRGRLFAADLAAMKKADDGVPQTVAPVEEIQLYVRDGTGNRVYVTLARSRRADDGREHDARRSAHQPQPGRRALHHVEAGRHDPDARSGFEGCRHAVREPATMISYFVASSRPMDGVSIAASAMPAAPKKQHGRRQVEENQRSAGRFGHRPRVQNWQIGVERLNTRARLDVLRGIPVERDVACRTILSVGAWMAESTSAQSSTVRQIHPSLSSDLQSAIAPVRGTRPRLDAGPSRAAAGAGRRDRIQGLCAPFLQRRRLGCETRGIFVTLPQFVTNVLVRALASFGVPSGRVGAV